MILIATPARLGTPRELVARCERAVHGLRHAGSLEWRLFYNEQAKGERKYGPNAAARNQFVERFVKPWHAWVLWVDVDILEMPANLIDVLLDCSKRHGGGIAAPMVWMERVAEGPVSIPVGGWFYDIGGFVRLDGQHADFGAGVGGEGDEVQMQSVGCVYLAPAELYRQGLRYEPVGNEVEHLSFMAAARARGTEVWATRRANVTHAYLPRYGETWGHERMEVAG